MNYLYLLSAPVKRDESQVKACFKVSSGYASSPATALHFPPRTAAEKNKTKHVFTYDMQNFCCDVSQKLCTEGGFVQRNRKQQKMAACLSPSDHLSHVSFLLFNMCRRANWENGFFSHNFSRQTWKDEIAAFTTNGFHATIIRGR